MNIGIVNYNTQFANSSYSLNKSQSVVTDFAFKGLSNSVRNVKSAEKHNKLASVFAKFILKTFCKPNGCEVDYLRANLYNLNYINHSGINEKAFEKVLKVLDIHSKNSEYSDFVKEGIDFFRKNKNNEKLYYVPNTVFSRVLDKGGNDLRFVIGSAFEKAIRPKSTVNDNALRTFIERGREYMDAFNQRGEHIYQDGFIKI